MTSTTMDIEPTKDRGVVLPVPTSKLLMWNVAMCIFHGIFGIVALVMGKLDLRVPVYGSSMGIEVMEGSSRGWKFGPLMPKRVGWLYLTVLVASFSVLSSVFHLGNALLWRKYYEKALSMGYAPFRWCEYCISASVMVMILSYVSGTVFQETLVLLFSLTFITMVFGHLHEVICRPKSLHEWEGSNKIWRLQAHLMGYIPQLFAWYVIIARFIDGSTASTTDSFGETRAMPPFVYGIVFGELLIFWSFGIVQLVVSLRPPSKYYQGEVAYMWLSLFAKGFLAMLCLANVILAGGYAEIYED